MRYETEELEEEDDVEDADDLGDDLPTQEDIADLVTATYSDQRPDPYDMTDEAEWIFRSVDDNAEQVVANFWVNPTAGVPPWEPGFVDRLEEYFSDQHDLYDETGHAAAEKRIGELREGAPLTEAEQNAYEKHYWDYDVIGECPSYYLYRLQATLPEQPGTSPVAQDSVYSIYFLGEYLVEGPMCELSQSAGPFLSLEEVMSAVLDGGNSPFVLIPGGELEFATSFDMSVTTALQGYYDAAQQREASAATSKNLSSPELEVDSAGVKGSSGKKRRPSQGRRFS